MIFIAADQEPTMVLMLTEQDCNDMRNGRTKFIDHTATKGRMFDKVVLSLHKNQSEIEKILRQAGHEALLHDMPSPVPKPQEVTCTGCQAIMTADLVLDGKCIACWREGSLVKTRELDRLNQEDTHRGF
jgi:hypothetical protein